MADAPLHVLTGKRDEDVAAELKAKIRAKLEEVCPLLIEARRAGFVPQFQLGVDQAGRDVVQSLSLAKFF